MIRYLQIFDHPVYQSQTYPTFNNNPRTSQGGEDKSVIDKLDDQIFGGSGSLWNN